MSKEPEVTCTPNGDVALEFSVNGHTLIVRLEPDTAEHLSKAVHVASVQARGVRAAAVKARNLEKGAGLPAVDFDATRVRERAYGQIVTPGEVERRAFGDEG